MTKKDLVVVGNGMVGHRFIELLLESDHRDDWQITTFCEEPRLAYDRVNLTSFFAGKTAERPVAGRAPTATRTPASPCTLGDRVDGHRPRSTDRSSPRKAGRSPTTSWSWPPARRPFVPPIPGRESRGCFVYRTVEDLERDPRAGRSSVADGRGHRRRPARPRGGQRAHPHGPGGPRRRVRAAADGAADRRRWRGALLRAQDRGARRLGAHRQERPRAIVAARAAASPRCSSPTAASSPPSWSSSPPASAPRDELARDCGLAIGERGGIVIDERCRTSDPDIFAIGECARPRGRTYGLVAPGYHMARVAADAIAGGERRALQRLRHEHQAQAPGRGRRQLRRRASPTTPGARVVSLLRRGRRHLQEAGALRPTGERLLGGVLVGDAVALRTAPAARPEPGCRCRRSPRSSSSRRATGGARRRPRRRRAARRAPPSAPATTSPRAPSARPSAASKLGRGRRRSRRAPRPAPAAARACRCSASCSSAS